MQSSALRTSWDCMVHTAPRLNNNYMQRAGFHIPHAPGDQHAYLRFHVALAELNNCCEPSSEVRQNVPPCKESWLCTCATLC